MQAGSESDNSSIYMHKSPAQLRATAVLMYAVQGGDGNEPSLLLMRDQNAMQAVRDKSCE
jgi:hypothetical protein